jgi:penicillin-binding protein-related factor A (putative recombinase)
MEIKKLHSIISDMEEIRQNDSVAISFLIIDNNTLNKAYQNASNELFNVKLELNKAKQKKRLNGFKIAAIGLGGFVGGVFVGLVR